jgi:hypothetical protein
MSQREVVIEVPMPAPRESEIAHDTAPDPRKKPLYAGPIGVVSLVLDYEGERVKIGQINERFLPPCEVCGKPIQLDVIINAATRGRPARYCGPYCRGAAGMRNTRKRQASAASSQKARKKKTGKAAAKGSSKKTASKKAKKA